MIFPERSAEYYAKMADRTVSVTLAICTLTLLATIWSGVPHV